MSNPNSDNIVYNISLSNNTSKPIPFTYNEFRSQYVLEKSEDYYIRIFQAKIPIMSVPFFNYSDDYYITVGNYQEKLNIINLVPRSNSIYYIDQFCEMMNYAFLRINHRFNDRPNPIKVFYSRNINKLSIYVPHTYRTNRIYFSSKLMFKLSGFFNRLVNLGNNKDYELIFDTGTTTKANLSDFSTTMSYPGFLIISQSDYFKDIQEFQSVILTTNTIKVNEQLISNGNRSDANNSFPILVELPISFDDLNSSKYLDFTQIVPKWTDLNTTGPLNRIDLIAYLVDSDYNLIPLEILPGQRANVRIQFIKKNLVKNY